jgi:hypothetical protein
VQSYLTSQALLVGPTSTSGSTQLPTDCYGYVIVDVEMLDPFTVLVVGNSTVFHLDLVLFKSMFNSSS